jgi:hypothetical protein
MDGADFNASANKRIHGFRVKLLSQSGFGDGQSMNRILLLLMIILLILLFMIILLILLFMIGSHDGRR